MPKYVYDFTEGNRDLKDLLGVPPHDPSMLNLEHKVGVATGLAYTSVGGEVLEIEVTATGSSEALVVNC